MEIVEAILETDAEIFLDQYDTPYIAFNSDGNSVNEINHSICRQYISDLCADKFGYVPTTSIENQVVKVLEAKARRSGIRHALDLSIVRHKKAIWYDMGNGAIQITSRGWKYVKRPPIVFRKPATQ